MKNQVVLVLAFLFSVVSSVSLAQAQVRYITDSLEVPLRAGTSTRYKIVRMLPSGTQVDVLTTDSKSGYSQVRVKGGPQGWILSRYLMDEPVPRERMLRAEQALEPLKAENADLKAQLNNVAGEKRQAESKYDKLLAENQRLSQELAQIHKAAANAIAIDQRNKELERQMVDLERELQIVQQENQILSDGSTRAWFLRGAGVLLLGGIIGLIIPRLRFQRRNRWGDL